MPAFECVDGSCEATRRDLDDYLYDAWYESERDDIEYAGDPELTMLNEGSYQGAFHFSKWMTSVFQFEYTALYNGSFWSTRINSVFSSFEDQSQPEVPAMMNRIHSVLYAALRSGLCSLPPSLSPPLPPFLPQHASLLPYLLLPLLSSPLLTSPLT